MGTFALSRVYLSLVVDNEDGVFRLGTDQQFPDFSLCEVVLSLEDLELFVEDASGGEPGRERNSESSQSYSERTRVALYH